MKKVLLLTSMLFMSGIYAQEHCAQDLILQKIYNEDPSLKPENNLAYQELEQFTKTFKSDNSNYKSRNINDLIIGTDYIIPVVVHVIHDNGPENISDKAVERSIEMLNRFFEGKSAYDVNIDPEFLPIRGAFSNKKLKFVLAKFDPSGNSTNGIDRHEDAYYTIRGDNNTLRHTYNWPRANYFNIYVVKQAVEGSGTSGFATFPPNVDGPANAYLDGHVMSAWAYGEHDQMWQTWYHNLAHEVGHWLNVYHIWANAGGNGNSVYCSYDDSVADTPNTFGNSLRDLDNFPGVGAVSNCSTKDNYTNMMDYTSATYAMFTNGQKARMEAALNSSVAERNNLWSINNVITTLYGCTIGPDSDNDNIPDICDTCPNDINNDSDGDGVCDSLDLCNGYPDVNVDSNPASMDSCDSLLPIIDFSTQTILTYDATQDKGVSDVYDNGASLHLSVNAWKAVALNYTITPNTIIEFDFKSTIEGEVHYIGIDDNLALDPVLAFKLFGFQTVTASPIYSLDYENYLDQDLYTYKHYSIPIGTYYTGNAPYLFFSADNDTFNEVWTSGNFYPGGGSYNDGTSFFRNVKIYESNTLSTPDINDASAEIALYPNPVNDAFTIKSNNVPLTKLSIHDINGRFIKTIKISNKQSETINIEEFASGVYFAIIETNSTTVVKKLIKL
ncbi:MAG: T9SS type A sorting domain-containing protein [Oceanihabitans sp.]